MWHPAQGERYTFKHERLGLVLIWVQNGAPFSAVAFVWALGRTGGSGILGGYLEQAIDASISKDL